MLQWEVPWPLESKEAKRIYEVRLDPPNYGNEINRGFCLHILAQYRKFEPELSSEHALERANTILILISRTLNMLEKYLKKLAAEFVAQGGFRERMSQVRSEARAQQNETPQEGPPCPKCGGPTRLRKTKQGNKPFWGCAEYPACRGIVDFQKPG